MTDLDRLAAARECIVRLRNCLIASHRHLTPLSTTTIDSALDDSNDWLDTTCDDGQPHDYRPVDGKPYPGICGRCDRPLP